MPPLNEADAAILTDLVDGTLSGPEWDTWLAMRPAAAELALARRVRSLMLELGAASIAVPPGFEARLLVRVHADTALRDLLDFSLTALGRAVLELFAVAFGLLPTPRTPATP